MAERTAPVRTSDPNAIRAGDREIVLTTRDAVSGVHLLAEQCGRASSTRPVQSSGARRLAHRIGLYFFAAVALVGCVVLSVDGVVGGASFIQSPSLRLEREAATVQFSKTQRGRRERDSRQPAASLISKGARPGEPADALDGHRTPLAGTRSETGSYFTQKRVGEPGRRDGRAHEPGRAPSECAHGKLVTVRDDDESGSFQLPSGETGAGGVRRTSSLIRVRENGRGASSARGRTWGLSASPGTSFAGGWS